MRLGWSPSTRAGLFGTGPMRYLPPMRPSRAPPVADDLEHGGGRGLGGTPLRWAAPESVALCLGAFTCLYRSGWARRVRPGGLNPS